LTLIKTISLLEDNESSQHKNSDSPNYEKKFTGNIIGLDSDDSDISEPVVKSSKKGEATKLVSHKKSKSDSDLDELNPPPPKSDAMQSDEYSDADEEYLESDKEKVKNGRSLNLTL
jgi:hypothetical protein